jgi:DNA polymerase III sliding clamp (beta) subunit (PCNA family)
MRVELPRSIFRTAVERLSVLGEAGKVRADAHTHLRLETLSGGLRLSAFARTMAAELWITEVRHSGFHFICGIPLTPLKELMATLPEADLIVLEFAEASCMILCGTVRFKTRILIEDAFPIIPMGELDLKPINLQFFFQNISLVTHCVDTASHREYAHGLLLTEGSMWATDGYRLAKSPDLWIGPERPLGLHMDTVTRLQKLFKGYQDGSVLLQPPELILCGGGIKAIARIATWRIPALGGVLKGPPGSVQIEVGKKALEDALERALIVASDKVPISNLEFSEKGLVIFTEEGGQAAEDPLAVKGVARMVFPINPRYLLDAVSSYEEDVIFIEPRGPETSLVLRNEGGTHVNVINPMQRAQ